MLRIFGRQRLVLAIIPVIFFAGIFGWFLSNNRGSGKAATALCYDQPAVFTAVAPASVYPGQTFTISNISAHANTSIATVNSSTVNLTTSGASPSSVSKTWSGGPVNGDYDANYGSPSFTVTGNAGSNVTVSINSISSAIVLGGANTTITCSVSNNQLTANSPGQSLQLVSIPIAAISNSGAPGQTSPTNTSPRTNSNNSAPTLSTPTTVSTPGNSALPTDTDTSNTESSPAANSQSISSGHKINVSVKDYQGQAVQGAEVVIDSLPIVTTNAQGLASFNSLAGGKHNVSVTAKGRVVTKAISLESQLASDVLTIQVKMPAPSHTLRNIILLGLLIITAAISLVTWRILGRHNKQTPLAGIATDPAQSVISSPSNDLQPPQA